MNKQEWEKQVASVLRLRWLILGAMVLANFINLLQRVALTVVADRVMAEFGLSATAFGNLAAIFFYVYAGMQIPAGIMVDTLGSRKTITLGCLSASLGSIAFGLAPTLLASYIGRFLVGMGTGVMWVCVMKTLTEWFRDREFATLNGLAASFSSIGGLLGATPLAIFVNHAGWRASFEVIGFVTFSIAAMCWLIVKNRPTDIGLPSIAESESYELSLKQARPQSSTSAQTISLMTKLKMVLGNKHSWLSLLVTFGAYAPFGTFITTWGVPYIMQVYGMSRDVAANYILVGTAGNIVGLASIGFISDKLMVKRKLPIILFASVSFLIWLAIILWNGGKLPPQFLYLICFSIGVSSNGVVVGFAYAKEVNLPTISGMATGFANIGGLLGTALLQPLFGFLLDLGWQGGMVEGGRVYPLSAYQCGFVLCLGVTLICIIAALLIKETRCQNIYSMIKG